jgi:hypothetical protein
MTAKTKAPKIPFDTAKMSGWLAVDPKGHVKVLETFITKSTADGFRRQAELLRIGLKSAWDGQPEAFFPLLRPWLKSTNTRLRRTAVGALPVAHPEYSEKCIRQLKKLISDKDRDVRLMAVDLLAEDVNGNLDLVKRWVKDSDPKVRELVTVHLRQLEADRIKACQALFEGLVVDSEPNVHWAAAATILELYEKEPRPMLELARSMANSEVGSVRSAAAGMFFEHLFADRFDHLLPTIRSWLRAGDPWLRWTLVRSLRFIRLTTRSLQLLRALYEDKDPEIRRRSILLLIGHYDPYSDLRRSVVDILRRAAQDTARQVRDAVEEGKKEHGDDFLEDRPGPSDDGKS